MNSFEHKQSEDSDPSHSLLCLSILLSRAIDFAGRGQPDDHVLYGFARVPSWVKVQNPVFVD